MKYFFIILFIVSFIITFVSFKYLRKNIMKFRRAIKGSSDFNREWYGPFQLIKKYFLLYTVTIMFVAGFIAYLIFNFIQN